MKTLVKPLNEEQTAEVEAYCEDYESGGGCGIYACNWWSVTSTNEEEDILL